MPYLFRRSRNGDSQSLLEQGKSASTLISLPSEVVSGLSCSLYQPPLTATLPRFRNPRKYDSILRSGDSPRWRIE
jgi:hypothetical protein